MKNKLKMLAGIGIGVLMAGAAMAADDLRNPVGGKIAQFTDFSGKVTWQLVQADSNACQKFISLFDSQPEVLKFAVDCWGDSDNESATLPVKIALKQPASGQAVTLESASPAACAAAVQVVESVGAYTRVDQCPAIPAPAPK